MKKIFTILVSALVVGASAGAQETFYPGWNYGVQIGLNHTQSYNSLKNDISIPAVSLNLGYEFNPWFGLRGSLSGISAKGTLLANDPDDFDVWVINDGSKFKFNFVQLSADAVFDICNMFKYRSDRGFNPYVLAGLGANVRFNSNADKALYPANYDYYWDGAKLGLAGRIGGGANIRINDAVKISLELVDNVLSNKFNTVCDNVKILGYNLRFDHNLYALAGVKFTFGQAAAKAAAIEAAAAAAAAKAAAEKAAAERAAAEKAAAEKAAAEKAAAEKAAAEAAAKAAAEAKAQALAAAKAAVAGVLENNEANPLFVIGKYNITKKSAAKVEAAAEILKVNPQVGVTLTGYADKETGTAAGNLELSQKRAETVADAIVNAGVDAGQLKAEWKGDTEVPYEGAKPAQKRTVTFKVN